MTNSLKNYISLHKSKIKLAFLFLLVSVFACLEWLLESRFYAVFIILFLILTYFFQRKRYFDYIIASAIVFVLFNTITMDTLLLLRRNNVEFVKHPKGILTTLFTPNSGLGMLSDLEIVPPQVLTMVSMLQTHKLENYQLSENNYNDIVINQRIVEIAWPIKMESNSPYIFVTEEEQALYSDCDMVEQKEDVILVDCH